MQLITLFLKLLLRKYLGLGGILNLRSKIKCHAYRKGIQCSYLWTSGTKITWTETR